MYLCNKVLNNTNYQSCKKKSNGDKYFDAGSTMVYSMVYWCRSTCHALCPKIGTRAKYYQQYHELLWHTYKLVKIDFTELICWAKAGCADCRYQLSSRTYTACAQPLQIQCMIGSGKGHPIVFPTPKPRQSNRPSCWQWNRSRYECVGHFNYAVILARTRMECTCVIMLISKHHNSLLRGLTNLMRDQLLLQY